MPRQLKVFRTPIGFHDAYVAAPSRKAALKAWGADVDLFARGAAEEVTDAGLMEEPLSRPGEIVRKARGSRKEHLAALPDRPERAQVKPVSSKERAKPRCKPKLKPKPKPRPSRAGLDDAEIAVAEAERRYDATRRDIADREAALKVERRALEAAYGAERKRLEVAQADQEARYARALKAWREATG